MSPLAQQVLEAMDPRGDTCWSVAFKLHGSVEEAGAHLPTVAAAMRHLEHAGHVVSLDELYCPSRPPAQRTRLWALRQEGHPNTAELRRTRREIAAACAAYGEGPARLGDDELHLVDLLRKKS